MFHGFRSTAKGTGCAKARHVCQNKVVLPWLQSILEEVKHVFKKICPLTELAENVKKLNSFYVGASFRNRRSWSDTPPECYQDSYWRRMIVGLTVRHEPTEKKCNC